MIKGIISGQSLKISAPLIVSDTIDYLTAEFTFSDDWDGMDKWAHFAHKSVDCGDEREIVYDVKLTDDRIGKTEHLNLTSGIWLVYLHGTRSVDGVAVERVTTESHMIAVLGSGVLEGEPLPLTPVTAAERIIAMIGDLTQLDTEAKSDLVSAVNEALAKIGDGKSGVTFTPSVSSDGTLSWTNDGELENPASVNIKGPQGEKGASGEKGDKGDPGEAGADGEDGYTPLKGTDYFTEADKAELVNDVLAALPTWEGGSY